VCKSLTFALSHPAFAAISMWCVRSSGNLRHAKQRFRTMLQVLHLQGIRSELPKSYLAANMSRYGMGTARSLADWERFAGVNLKLQQVAHRCMQC
jgi:hypothetical protein